MPDERNYYDDRQYQDEYYEQQYSPPPPSPPPPQHSVRIWSKLLPHWIYSKNNFTGKYNAPHLQKRLLWSKDKTAMPYIVISPFGRWGMVKILWDPNQS